MSKNRFNNLLRLSIERRNLITSKNFFLRLISNLDMIIQTIFCFLLRKINSHIILRTKTFWGKTMKIVLPEVISSEIRRFGYFEEKVAFFIINNCSNGDTVIDIGSHYGFFALLMSEIVGDNGSVHCFEPTPSTFSVLKKNIKGNKNIVINRKAILEKNIEIELNDYGISSSAFNSINQARLKINKKQLGKNKIKVEAIKLDDYVILNNLIPSLIKIDAESSEYEVIKGMDYILKEIKPDLCVELGDFGIEGVLPSREIVNLLTGKYGYNVYEMNNSKLITHYKKDKYNYTNLFFKQ